MDRQEELRDIIDKANEELSMIEEDIPLEEPSLNEQIKGASDYTYWRGKSRHIVDILNAEVHPITIGERQRRMYEVELSHSEMESSQEMDLRIIRFWKQETVVERGQVTHFRKADIVEKRYNWNWELIR